MKVYPPEIWEALEQDARAYPHVTLRRRVESLRAMFPGKRVPGRTQIGTHLRVRGLVVPRPKAKIKALTAEVISSQFSADPAIHSLLAQALRSAIPSFLLGGFFVRRTGGRPRCRVRYLVKLESGCEAEGLLALDTFGSPTLELVGFFHRVATPTLIGSVAAIRLFLAPSWRNGPFRPLDPRSKIGAKIPSVPFRVRWGRVAGVDGACAAFRRALSAIIFGGVGDSDQPNLGDRDLRLLAKYTVASVTLTLGRRPIVWAMDDGDSDGR